MSIEAMKLAIEAWDACGRYPDTTSDIDRLDVAINALRTAIQQAEVTDEQILATGREWSKEQGWWDFEANDFLGCARAILALRPERVPMTYEQRQSAKRTPREIARSLKDSGMACNCDLDRWEPEKATGHSHVCRIHKAAMSAHHGISAQAKNGTPCSQPSNA